MDNNGLVDSVSRSLHIRIVKEAGTLSDVKAAVKRTFGFDLDFPSAPPSLLDTGQNPPCIDKHSLNTLLNLYAKQMNLSRMISVFESTAHPLPMQSSLIPKADQNSFFSPNQGGSTAKESLLKSMGISFGPSMQSSSSLSMAKASFLAIPSPEHSQSCVPPSSTDFNVSAINTSSFELLIETANQLGSHAISNHYLQEMLRAWEQERVRLRLAYSDLADCDVSNATGINPNPEEATVLLPPTLPLSKVFRIDVPCPSVSPSVHAIYSLFEHLKTSSKRWKHTAILTALLRQSQQTLDKLREDVLFWAGIVNKKRLFMVLQSRNTAKALDAQEANDNTDTLLNPVVAEKDLSSRKHIESCSKRFRTKIHLLLIKRTEIELEGAIRRIETVQTELATQNFMDALLYELSGRRGGSTVARLRTAIKRAERWLMENKSVESHHVAALASNGMHSEQQMSRTISSARHRTLERRRKLKTALARAKIALPRLIQEKVEASKASHSHHGMLQGTIIDCVRWQDHHPVPKGQSPEISHGTYVRDLRAFETSVGYPDISDSQYTKVAFL